jgi:hypothetical protein
VECGRQKRDGSFTCAVALSAVLLNRFQAYAPLRDSLRERLLTSGPRCSAGLLDRYLRESVRYYPMSKPGISFTRRAPDNITEELVAVLSSKASFEFKPLFDIILINLRERNAASGGEEMLRLRSYEKLQGLVSQGAVTRTVTGITKKYKGVAPRMVTLRAEMKVLRSDWAQKLRAKAAAAT